MPQYVYEIERNRGSRKYKIAAQGRGSFFAVRESGIARGVLVIFLGLMGFLVGGAATAMLSVVMPNFPVSAIYSVLPIATAIFIFFFWPARRLSVATSLEG